LDEGSYVSLDYSYYKLLSLFIFLDALLYDIYMQRCYLLGS